MCTLGAAQDGGLRAQTAGTGSVGSSCGASRLRLKDIKRGRLSVDPAIATNLAGSVAALTLLMGCASAPTDSLDWSGFVASFAGESERRTDYPHGVSKGAESPQVAASMKSGATRFESWCSAHAGTADQTQRFQASSAAASRFQAAVSAKLNANRAHGEPWVPSIAMACVDKDTGALVAAMLSIQGYQHEAVERDGRRFDKLVRVFFDGRQAEDFAAYYASREDERSTRVAAESAIRQAARDEATRRLRTRPQIGDRTSVGTVIELRPPLALVQYDRRYREVSGRPPSEWLRIDGLSAPSD